MPVFQVYLNGKKVSTAGVGEQGVLSAHVTWVRRAKDRPAKIAEEELTLDVGGLITASGEHVRWLDRKLKVGDEVRIVIVESGKVAKPQSRKRRDRAKDLRAQKRYVKEMAKKFGWKIQAKK